MKKVLTIIIILVAAVAAYYFITYYLAVRAAAELRSSLDASLSSLASAKRERPPLWDVTPGTDGGQRVMSLAQAVTKNIGVESLRDVSRLFDENLDAKVAFQAGETLERIAPYLTELRGAVESEECHIVLDLANPKSTPPHTFKALGVAMVKRGTAQRQAGRFFDAIRWFFAAARFGQDFSFAAPLHYREAGAEVTCTAFIEAFRLLQTHEFKTRLMKQLLKAAKALEKSEPPFSLSLDAECCFADLRARRAGKGIGILPGFASMPGSGIKEFSTFAGYVSARKELRAWFLGLKGKISANYPQMSEMLTRKASRRIFAGWLVRSLAWDFSEVYRKHTLALTYSRAMVFLLRLRRYQQDNGVFPQGDISGVGRWTPIDPFSEGKKFAYVHSTVLTTYFSSVGSDGILNQGKAVDWKDEQGKDIRIPVTPLHGLRH